MCSLVDRENRLLGILRAYGGLKGCTSCSSKWELQQVEIWQHNSKGEPEPNTGMTLRHQCPISRPLSNAGQFNVICIALLTVNMNTKQIYRKWDVYLYFIYNGTQGQEMSTSPSTNLSDQLTEGGDSSLLCMHMNLGSVCLPRRRFSAWGSPEMQTGSQFLSARTRSYL